MTSVRRNIWNLGTPQDPWHPVTLSYAQGVAAMQALPAADPRSWTYQAAIHGTYLTNRPSGAPWNTCQHATWYFLPWHRMYLYRLENILRTLLPPADRDGWALPFWDYSSGAPGNSLPPAFRTPTLPDGTTPNPLFVTERRPSVNAGGRLPSAVTDTSVALAQTVFTVSQLGGSTGFGGPRTGFAHQGPAFGELEASPHGPVHVVVGGSGGLMTDPNTAALDPIFWLHHANIDRLWEVWNIGGGTNPAVLRWRDRSFRLRNVEGRTVRMRAKDVLDTVGQLDYTYENLPVRAAAGPEQEEDRVRRKKSRPVLIGSNAEPVEIDAAGGSARLAVTPLPESAAAAALPSRVYLNLTDIEGGRNPGVVYGVYLNLPTDTTGETDTTATTDEDRADHLAGVVSFFGIEDTDPATRAATSSAPHGMRYSFDVTDLVNRLRARGAWEPDQLDVSLLPLTSDEPAPPSVPDESLAAGGHLAPPPPARPVRVGTVALYQE